MGAADSGRTAMTNEQVCVIGKAFAHAYYAALVARPATLRRFYGHRSEHLFTLHGREDITTHSPEAVQRFAARMGYDRCRVRVKSVDTMQVWANRFVVLVVGKMMCSRRSTPVGRKFIPSTVVWRRKLRKFSIVGTVFMFDDVTFVNDRKNTTCTENDDDCKLKPSFPPLIGIPLPVQKLCAVPTAIKNNKRTNCVHVVGLPNGFNVEDFWTEFSRFGEIYGVYMTEDSNRKNQSKSLCGTVWYYLAKTADAVIQLGKVTLTNGHVVAVEEVTNE